MPSGSAKPCRSWAAVTVKAVSSVPARSVAWVPVSSGASFAAVIVTVVVPVAVAAPSGPWAPVLPSENVQASP
ncbi:hypothetical protein ASF32_12975 [Methylobacterium sp. Leaf91]|nr:hypothetical protein ASF32_12975 [Methylobacterium sp. Leaf91]